MRGFTLIEMMVVLGVLAILALIAAPSVEGRSVRSQVIESVDIIKPLKETVTLYYGINKFFPKNNLAAGIPKAELLLGNFVQRVDLEDGAFTLVFGNKANSHLANRKLTIRPIVVKGSLESPISWLCGNSAVPEGMIASGKNQTDVAAAYLPFNCL